MNENKTRIAVIDTDGIIFATACSAEYRAKDGDEDIYLQALTTEEAYRRVTERIDELVFRVEAARAILCLSDRENFRYALLPSYKGNRVEGRRPPLIAELRELLTERKPWPVMNVKGLEADDVCGIAAGTLCSETTEVVICSPDKDLKTIPGLYYACRMDSQVEVISSADADRNHMFQTLVGDTTDNYTGCPKVGKVKAGKLLDACEGLPEADRWARIVEEFTSRGFSAEYALTQARVARILRASDWDADNHEVILWEPPVSTAQREAA